MRHIFHFQQYCIIVYYYNIFQPKCLERVIFRGSTERIRVIYVYIYINNT